MFNLYENIRQLCSEKGTTVSAMCDEIGISKSTLSNLKNGRTTEISTTTAQKIAKFLDVSFDEVKHGKKNTPAREDEELANYLQAIHDRPKLRAMFKAGKNASEEKLDAILALLGGDSEDET